MVAKDQIQSPAEIGVKVLAEKKTPAYALRLQLGAAQLKLHAFITIFDAENSISPSELIELLAANGVKESLDLEEVAKFCSKAAMGISQEEILLASGREPLPGKDGWLELTVKTGAGEDEYAEDDRGYVDLRTRQNFTNVEIGQQIGIIHPPEFGAPGITAHGLPIPPLKGAPLDLTAGDGVELDREGRMATATKSGRAVFDGHTLSVAEEFSVRGDVDLSVGNINFNGFVEIKGDVLDDFNIRASKGIRVTGAVGACRLETEGPVEIGSMAGLGTGLIRCKGDLRASYLNQVQVECWGNVIVGREIRNCSIKATRAILIERGTISGGEAIALDGIEAKDFGAVSGIRTQLTAGVYFPEADRLKLLRQKQRSYNLQVQRIAAALGPLGKRKEMRKSLQEAIDLRVSLLTERKAKIEIEKELVDNELASFATEEHPSANPKINVLGRLREGVVINLGETVAEIKTMHTGPLSIIEDSVNQGLRFLEHSPLTISAAEAEQTMIATETVTQEEE